MPPNRHAVKLDAPTIPINGNQGDRAAAASVIVAELADVGARVIDVEPTVVASAAVCCPENGDPSNRSVALVHVIAVADSNMPTAQMNPPDTPVTLVETEVPGITELFEPDADTMPGTDQSDTPARVIVVVNTTETVPVVPVGTAA